MGRWSMSFLEGDTNLAKDVINVSTYEYYMSHTPKECNWGDQNMTEVSF